ncbi:MAG: energy transducer TonB [Sphingobium sp.]|nr:energy transducer TonB [Sphingobium sp.]
MPSFTPTSGYKGNQKSGRSIGLILTATIHALVLGAFFIHWTVHYMVAPQPALSTFNVAPPAAPPEPERETPPGPEQVEQELIKPRPHLESLQLPPPEIMLRSESNLTLTQPIITPAPSPPVEKTTAPESKPMPPAPQISTTNPTWEGKVLAAINKVKRYPPAASARRQQGVPWIRFVMDRKGKVLSSQLERSSGQRLLDIEAVALPKRAQPLPPPPESMRGETIELVMQVEFFMR